MHEFNISTSLERKIIEEKYNILDPVYSPDGLKIAFALSKDGQSDIFLINADGSNLVKVTNLSYPNQILLLVWSPDNSKIMYRYWEEVDDGSLYIINIDGSNLVKIADFGGNQSWSPDMTRISYGVFDDDSEYGASILIYDIETFAKTKLTDGVGAVWLKIKL